MAGYVITMCNVYDEPYGNGATSTQLITIPILFDTQEEADEIVRIVEQPSLHSQHYKTECKMSVIWEVLDITLQNGKTIRINADWINYYGTLTTQVTKVI